MALYKLKDFDPQYRESFDQDVVGFDLYANGEKVGTVDDLLVDEAGRFRYFVINTGIWIFGKRVLLPIGRARMSATEHRIYADGLTREQVEALPDYKDDMTVDYEHEESTRNVYRSDRSMMGAGSTPVDSGAALEQPTTASTRSTSMASDAAMTGNAALHGQGTYDRDTYSYDRDPNLYNMDETNHQNLRLYEERLLASKTRRKTGEVAVGKRVETETARVAVPVEKERVVIERHAVSGTDASAVGSGDAFQEGEVVRMEVYEETPDIRKEAFVREEVSIRKEVDRETVETQETLRKEQLDVDSDGNPVIDNPGSRRDRI